MSMNTTIVSETELSKSVVLNSDLDDDTKRNLVTLLTKSAIATNGVTPEEKIQYLTECMASLASSFAMCFAKEKQITNERLIKLEAAYTEDHPKAKIEQLHKREHELYEVEEYRNMNGIIPNIKISGECIQDILKGTKQYIDAKFDECDGVINKIFKILEKPYVWIFGAVAVCSPFAADLLDVIFSHVGK